MPDLVLAIETSHTRGSVALGQVGESPRLEMLPPGLVHARELHPAIDRVTQAYGATPADLDGIVVSHGPGSYTGIRVGVSTAKSLGYALDIPAIGRSSLETIARHAALESSHTGELWVVVDARRGTCYSARFRCESGAITRVSPDRLDEVAPLFASLDTDATLVGSGARTLPGAENFDRLPESLDCPDASSIFAVGATAFAAGASADLTSNLPPATGEIDSDPHALMPVYFRPSEAEEKRARDQGADSN